MWHMALFSNRQKTGSVFPVASTQSWSGATIIAQNDHMDDFTLHFLLQTLCSIVAVCHVTCCCHVSIEFSLGNGNEKSTFHNHQKMICACLQSPVVSYSSP